MKYLLAILALIGWTLAVVESNRANFWECAADYQCRNAEHINIARACLFVKLHDWQEACVSVMKTRPLFRQWKQQQETKI